MYMYYVGEDIMILGVSILVRRPPGGVSEKCGPTPDLDGVAMD